MSKVTSKLQITVPKALAERYGIEPGDEVEWVPAGDAIRMVPRSARPAPSQATRLHAFDQATARQRARETGSRPARSKERGWTREELYDRGRTR